MADTSVEDEVEALLYSLAHHNLPEPPTADPVQEAPRKLPPTVPEPLQEIVQKVEENPIIDETQTTDPSPNNNAVSEFTAKLESYRDIWSRKCSNLLRRVERGKMTEKDFLDILQKKRSHREAKLVRQETIRQAIFEKRKQLAAKVIFLSSDSDSEVEFVPNPPEVSDDPDELIYVEPPPPPVVDIEDDSNPEFPINTALHRIEEASNDFILPTSSENLKFNFRLHGAEFDDDEFAQPAQPTIGDHYETESSTNTSETGNRHIDTSVKSIVFPEEDFPSFEDGLTQISPVCEVVIQTEGVAENNVTVTRARSESESSSESEFDGQHKNLPELSVMEAEADQTKTGEDLVVEEVETTRTRRSKRKNSDEVSTHSIPLETPDGKRSRKKRKKSGAETIVHEEVPIESDRAKQSKRKRRHKERKAKQKLITEVTKNGNDTLNNDGNSEEQVEDEDDVILIEKVIPTHTIDSTDSEEETSIENFEGLMELNTSVPELPPNQLLNRTSCGGDFSVSEVQSRMSKDVTNWKILSTDRHPQPHGPAPNRCNRCRDFGHHARHCTKRKLMICALCGAEGHEESRCTHKVCLNCGEACSVAGSSCRKCAKHLISSRCQICNMRGHLKQKCPDMWRRYYLTIENGPVVEPSSSNSEPATPWCSGCGTSGHFEHECNSYCWIREYPSTSPFIVSYANVYDSNKPNSNAINRTNSTQNNARPTAVANPFSLDWPAPLNHIQCNPVPNRVVTRQQQKIIAQRDTDPMHKKFHFDSSYDLQLFVQYELSRLDQIKRDSRTKVMKKYMRLCELKRNNATDLRIACEVSDLYQIINMYIFGIVRRRRASSKLALAQLNMLASEQPFAQALNMDERNTLLKAYLTIFSCHPVKNFNYGQFFQNLSMRRKKK